MIYSVILYFYIGEDLQKSNRKIDLILHLEIQLVEIQG